MKDEFLSDLESVNITKDTPKKKTKQNKQAVKVGLCWE